METRVGIPAFGRSDRDLLTQGKRMDGEANQVLHQDDPCPKCKVGFLERVSHRFSSDRGPNLPDCDWLLCLDCGFETEPE